MTFEEALVQELESIPSLASTWVSTVLTWNTADRLWETDSAQRVHPLTSPEYKNNASPPFVIFQSSEGVQTKVLGGYQERKRVEGEINVAAVRYSEMKGITRDVISHLIGMEGRVIGTAGPLIRELTYEAPVELYEEQAKLYRSLIDFEVYF